MHARRSWRVSPFSLSPSPASALAGCDDHGGDPRNADRRQSRAARAAAVSDAADTDRKSRRMGRRNSDGAAGIAGPCLGDRLCSIRGRSTSSPMGMCWWLRAMVRKRRFTGPRTSSPAGCSGSPAPRQRTQTASRCCATPMATAFPSCAPCFWITSTRRLVSPWLATISTSRTPMPSSAIRIRMDRPASPQPGTKLTDLPGGPIDHHWTKALLASPDGSKLYVGVGSNSNITENGIGAEYERAAIWEVDRASGAHRIFASGVRNPTGLQWEPETGKLWAIANERDEIGPDLVPDYLTSVQDGGFYGWPYSYYGQHLDPRVMPQRPDLVASAIAPDYALSSHVAPLGLAMYARHRSSRQLPRRCLRRRTRKLGSNASQRLQGGLRAVQRRKAQRPGAGCRHRLPRCEQSRARDGRLAWQSIAPAHC